MVGAVGDGVTDDTIAIQNSINFAIKVNKSLYIPGGTYNISKQSTLDTMPNSSDTLPIQPIYNCLIITRESNEDASAVYDYTEKLIIYGDGANTVLNITTTDCIGIRLSNSNCLLENFVIQSDLVDGIIGIALYPKDINQTIYNSYMLYNTVNNLTIVNCEFGINLTYGPLVSGYNSGCWYNIISNTNIRNCISGITEIRRDTTLFSGGTGRNIYNKVYIGGSSNCNIGFDLNSGTNAIISCRFENINKGTAPALVPTAIRILGGAGSLGTTIISPILEACTRNLEHDSLYTSAIGCDFTSSNSLLTTPIRSASGTELRTGGYLAFSDAISNYNNSIINLDYSNPKLQIQMDGTTVQEINSNYTKISDDISNMPSGYKNAQYHIIQGSSDIATMAVLNSGPQSGAGANISSEFTSLVTDSTLYAGSNNGVRKFRVSSEGDVECSGVLRIGENISTPTSNTGKVTLYSDSAGVLKVMFGDGTVKTVSLT